MIESTSVKPYLSKARYGVEKEGQRVDLSGNLTTTNHPAPLSTRDDHPYIKRDFSETQMELVTPVTDSLDELFSYLSAIHDVAYRSMEKNEMLWPLSMPPALPEREEDIVIAKLNDPENVRYRESLATSYGRRKQMISGIHYNFQFGDELIQALFDAKTEIKEYRDFKTEVYLKTTRNYLHYQWLITYLFGASPSSEPNFFENNSLEEPIRSIRSSDQGYKNNDDVEVSYSELENYISDITSLVEKGLLVEEKEFYSPVRLRGGTYVADLKDRGVKYIELRNIDINPFAKNGIGYQQAEFLHIYLLYLLWEDEGTERDEWVNTGSVNNNKVALEHPLQPTQFQADAEKILDKMEQLVKTLGINVSDTLFSNIRKMILNPVHTLAGKLYKESTTSSQGEVATNIAKDYYNQAWAKPYELSGYTDMELSTQLLIFDAIQQGIEVEVIDRHDQFLKLQLEDHVEYVKNGNMTSKDSYISTLIMENKIVTKKILHEHGFRVPMGEEYNDIEHALNSYDMFASKAFVVKPKSTNYGLGISIFQEGTTYEDYERAIILAFEEDTSILIEEFLAGTEYRFFVLDGEVLAVMQRIAANIKGDGTQTIEELVHEKNRDPLRGTDHRTPLEKIQLGELEKLMLKGQSYQLSSVPKKDEIIFLRENSNVSTGGDSIDVTAHISDDYKKIATDAVVALEANISGIDLIIEDREVPATSKNAYGILEANFNPSMYMHVYPYQGESKRVTMNILQHLFPEL